MATSAKPKRRQNHPAPYDWFQGASVRELYDRLSAAGPDTARLEVRVEGKSMTLRVLAANEDAAKVRPTDINDSKRCPPICP